MTLAGILADKLDVRNEEATAILYELNTVRRGTRTIWHRAGLPHLA